MDLETRLLAQFVTAHPRDASATLEAMPASDRAQVLGELDAATAGSLVTHLARLSAARAIEAMPLAQATGVLAAAQRQVAAAILRATSADRRSSVLGALPASHKEAIKTLLRYTEDTAGALMDPYVVTLSDRALVSDALDRLRQDPEHARYYVYVVNEGHRLTGVVSMGQLLRARPEVVVASITKREVESVSARASWETVASHPAWDRVHSVPVVDTEQRLVGVIRYGTFRDLERRLSQTSRADQGQRAASALGEVYGLGLSGLARWAASWAMDGGRGER